jgi:hypothetical protein
MKTLADEILDALPALVADHPRGASVEDIAKLLCAPGAHVRVAIKALHDQRRAAIARWPGSKRRFLIPIGHDLGRGMGACPNCYAVFKLNPNKAPCCSRKCGSQLWVGDRERGGAQGAYCRRCGAQPRPRDAQPNIGALKGARIGARSTARAKRALEGLVG